MTIIATKSEIKLIKDVLGLSLIEYERFCDSIIFGFLKKENMFLAALGTALSCALNDNQHKDVIRILHSWQRECSQASMEFRIWEAKEKALKKGS